MEGNQMKMRETLLVVRDALDTISAHEDDIEFVRAWIAQTKNAVQEALAAPPRHCDVGTAEEQGERCLAQFDQWRRKGDGKKLITAIMAWAQTPYEAQEGGADEPQTK